VGRGEGRAVRALRRLAGSSGPRRAGRLAFRCAWLVLFLYFVTPVHYPERDGRLGMLAALAGAALVLDAAWKRREAGRGAGRTRWMAALWLAIQAGFWVMALGSLAMALPVLVAFRPAAAGLLLAALGVLALLQGRVRGVRPGLVTWFTPIWAVQVLQFAVMATHFAGASDAECASVYADGRVRPLLDREALAAIPGLGPAFPYDAAYDTGRDLVVATLKDRRAGYWSTTDEPGQAFSGLVLLSRDDPARSSFFPIRNEGGASLPQNLVADPATQSVAAYVVDREFRHSVRTWSYASGRLEPVATRVFEDFEPAAGGAVGEPSGILGSAETGRILVNLYRGKPGWLWEADLPSLGNERFTPVGRRFSLLDKMARDPSNGQVIVASNHGAVLFLDGRTLETIDAVPTLDPVSTVAVDPGTGDVIAAGIVGGELIRIDGATRRIVDRAWTVRVPRSLAVVPEFGLLFVSGYVEGRVRVHDLATLETLGEVAVGGVSRTLHFQAGPGVVSACSSCGLLEIDVAAVAAELGRSRKAAGER